MMMKMSVEQLLVESSKLQETMNLCDLQCDCWEHL